MFDDLTGRVRGVVVGAFLVAARAGAMAVDVLASERATSLALVGTGQRAWTQVWAINAVRELREVRVFGRDPERRERFVQRCRAELGLPALAVPDPRAAMTDAEIVVLATNSGTPMVDAGWISQGALAQLDGYAQPFFPRPHPAPGRMRSLAEVTGRPEAGATTLFCSAGHARTEVAVAAMLFDGYRT